MNETLRLGPEDPTVFAKCPKCSRMGIGEKSGRQFYRAYTYRRWLRKPKCENCRTPMVMLYAIKEEKREEPRRRTSPRSNFAAGRNRERGRMPLRASARSA